MNNVLLYIGGFLVAVLAALFAIPHFIDWNSYRGVFEAEASRAVGADVRVGGEVNVRFLPTPYVRLEKIKIGETDGESGESLFRTESFKMWLAVPPLLRGAIEADEVELKRPVLRLTSDAAGQMNWSSLHPVPGELSFIPVSVSLKAVNLINGVINLIGPSGTEIARIDKINGEFNAEYLQGPYKFKGTANWEGAEREIRVATAQPEANGDVRFKTTVIVGASKNSYVLDGRVADLKTRPHIEGELTSKQSLSALIAPAPAAADAGKRPETEKPASGEPAPEDGPGTMELRGNVTGDATGFNIADVAISIEQGGPPQIITGQAKTSWAEKVRIDAGLESQWLDFDRKGGASSKIIPAVVVSSLFDALVGALPVEAETNLSLKFSQINLGGDSLGDVALAVESSGGVLQLREFRARIPGGGTFGLDGALNPAPKEGDPKFTGSLSLSGQSTTRFLAWAFKAPGIVQGRGDAPYTLNGRLQFGDRSVELLNAQARLGDMPLKGQARLDLGANRRLGLSIDGERIDVGQFLPGIVGLNALGVLRPAQSEADAPDVKAAFYDPARSDLGLRVKAKTLIDGELTLRDVDMDIAIAGRTLAITDLAFRTDDGLALDAEGSIENVGDKPKGQLRGIVEAKSHAATRTLMRLLDLSEPERILPDRLAEFTPLRLAGTATIGKRTPTSFDIKADGISNGGRLVADVRLDGGRQAWRSSQVDILAVLDGPNTSATLATVFNYPASVTPLAEPPSQSRSAYFRAAGIPTQGLLTSAVLKADSDLAVFNGKVTVPETGSVASGGTIKISARDGRELLAIAGITLPEGARGTALDGLAEFSYANGAATFASPSMTVGEATLSGTVGVLAPAGNLVELTGEIDVQKAVVPRMLRPLLAGPARPGEVQFENAALTAGLWPEETFDLSFLERLNGNLKVTVQNLALQEGLTVKNARLSLALTPRSVEISSLEGEALGGHLKSQLAFEKGAAGVELKGKLAISVGQAPGAPDKPDPLASSLSLDFSGRALSPAALMVDLKGAGELSLGDVTLTGMGPVPVAETVDAALTGKGPTGGEPFVEALKQALKKGQIRLGALKIPVTIADGTMKLGKIGIETEDGRSTFETAVELATMRVDSEWNVEAKARVPAGLAGSAKPLLPAVSVVYTGSLAGLGTIEPIIDATALERELIVRKMENDVEALERLRKFDQSKAAQDAERQKKLEAERAKAAAEAAAAAQAARGEASVPEPIVQPDPNAQVVPGENIDPQATTATGAPPPEAGLGPVPAPVPVRRKPAAEKRPAQSSSPYPLPF